MLGKLWQRARRLFSPALGEDEMREHLEKLRKEAPTPVFWMVGKTQSGKTSLVRYLTGAERAEIGRGFQPCTRFSSKYVFPSEQAPLLCFLDTRGLDEPGYDPAEDVARFENEAHVVLVVVKALDHAQQNVLATLKRLRSAQRRRHVVLVLTCLHEAYPQQQHPLPYPFGPDAQLPPDAPPQLADLATSIAEQKRRFDGLVDRVVAVDLTPPEEGFNEPNYGGEALRQILLDVLPAAQAQSLRTLELAQKQLRDLYSGRAQPTILGYATLAGTAGAVPIPFVDLALISAVQTSMVYELAKLYGQPLTAHRLYELASALGLGILSRQAGRALIKVIPGLGTVIGSVAGGALAAASTYALGQAFCYYYRAVLEGHVPDPADLRRYYKDQLDQAETAWKQLHPATKK
jgi:uncharacterized protein (DUF697 family)/predicted GTPase